jgi:hypothetical protein
MKTVLIDGRRSLYWMALAKDPGKAAWIWAISLVLELGREVYPLYRDALTAGLQREAEEWDMALKGFLFAWVTIFAFLSVWIGTAIYILNTYPHIADAINYSVAALILWWAWKVERGPADRAKEEKHG